MRLLHVVPTYAPAWRHGGPIRAVHGLCRALAARGHEVTVFTTDVDTGGAVPAGRAVPLDGVEVWYFPVRAPRRLYRSPAMAAALRRRVGGFDLVHLHSVFLWPTMAAARAAARAGVPFLLAPRGMLVHDLVRRRGRLRKLLWINLVERRTLARAAGLHVTSDLEAAEAAGLRLPLPHVFTVPNGVEDEPWDGDEAALAPAVRRLLAGGPFLLFLGRLSWKKGLDRLIAALPDVPGAALAIAGPDDEGCRPTLERLARALGLGDRILFLGPVDGADRAALLHRAAALVLPSYSENFGNAVLEAMAAGRPVVVTPEVGLAAVVREVGAGLVVEAESEPLAAALSGLLADPAAADAMGRRGAAAAREHFAWKAVAAQMEAAYETARAGGARPAQEPAARLASPLAAPVNLAFVVERPTQFEVPLYRHAASDPSHRLRVIYTAPDPAVAAFDPELGRPVDWGFDLLGGYDHASLPSTGRARWLAAEMRRGRYDLVIVNGYTRAVYLQAARAARRAGSATALRLDSVAFDGRPTHPLARRLLFRLGLSPLFDLFLGVGTLSLEYLRSVGVPERRTALLPYPIDAEGFRRRAALSAPERDAARRRIGVPPEARVVLSVAKLHPREAPWDLLHAFAEEDQVDGSWLVVAGDGPERAACERFVHERGLDRVVFTGYVPYPHLPALYAAADVFVHPAREERWGVSVAEALACGLPVVASSRVGAAHDLVKEGVNGFTYPAGSPIALAGRIARAAALDRAAVAAHNERALAAWNQAATWRGLIAAAEPFVDRQKRWARWRAASAARREGGA